MTIIASPAILPTTLPTTTGVDVVESVVLPLDAIVLEGGLEAIGVPPPTNPPALVTVGWEDAVGPNEYANELDELLELEDEVELSDEEELEEVRYVSDDREDADEVEEFVKLPEKLLELEINGVVVELELTRSDEKLVGIERVDVGAKVVLKLESKDCDGSAERPVTCDESAVVGVGIELEVVDV